MAEGLTPNTNNTSNHLYQNIMYLIGREVSRKSSIIIGFLCENRKYRCKKGDLEFRIEDAEFRI
jgi:hypothetical protein